MVMYELINKNRELIKKLIAKGVVGGEVLRNAKLYEDYLELQAKMLCVMCRYAIIAEKYNMSEETARKIIKKMSD